MPINMGLAALMMASAMNAGEPAPKLTLGADAVSQANGGAAVVLVAKKSKPLKIVQSKPLAKKPGKKKVDPQADARAIGPGGGGNCCMEKK